MPAGLAAIVPEFGSFHKGFALAPSEGVPLLDLHGSQDTTVLMACDQHTAQYVAVKLMRNRASFERAVKARRGLDAAYVLPTILSMLSTLRLMSGCVSPVDECYGAGRAHRSRSDRAT